MKKFFPLLLLASLMAGCSDDDTTVPSTVDDKPWTLDEYKSASYSPGDNFYMYCVGSWYEKADYGDYTSTGADAAIAEMGNRITEWENTSSDYQTILSDTLRLDGTEQAALAYVAGHADMIGHATTKEEAWRDMARLMKLGYTTMVMPTVQIYAGKNYIAFDVKNIGKPNLSAAEGSQESGATTAGTRTRASSTGGSGYTFVDILAEELGISADNLYLNSLEYNVDSIYKVIEQCPLNELNAFNQLAVANMHALASRQRLEDYEAQTRRTNTLDSLVGCIDKMHLAYVQGYDFAQKYVPEALKTQFKAQVEELRTAFRQRLAKLDWMSETTRQNALEKLDAMQIAVGSPDEWHEEFMVHPTGRSFLEDYLRLSANTLRLTLHLAGKQLSKTIFEQSITSGEGGLTTVNAFYNLNANAVIIYPVFMLPPIYDETQSDAINYAAMSVYGHEMTHGFDNDGAKYDKTGKPGNWWTNADKLEFQARLQKLANSYSLLEVDPVNLPGVYADGQFTLAENVADLGGVQIAHDAYMKKLAEQGYTGDELVKQEKKFFEGYACFLGDKKSPDELRNLLFEDKDTHSQSKERVNGVVMNIDRWYELYNVSRENYLYLTPEQRAYIW